MRQTQRNPNNAVNSPPSRRSHNSSSHPLRPFVLFCAFVLFVHISAPGINYHSRDKYYTWYIQPRDESAPPNRNRNLIKPRKVQNDGAKAQACLDWGRAGVWKRTNEHPLFRDRTGLEHFIFICLLLFILQPWTVCGVVKTYLLFLPCRFLVGFYPTYLQCIGVRFGVWCPPHLGMNGWIIFSLDGVVLYLAFWEEWTNRFWRGRPLWRVRHCSRKKRHYYILLTTMLEVESWTLMTGLH